VTCTVSAAVSVPQLTELAISGLERMFDAERQLFCFRVERTPGGLVREGHSHRYTVISLLGLRRLEIAGQRSPVPITPVFDRLLRSSDWVDNLGDLGLLLWLGALACPERVREIDARWGLKNALERSREAREGRTMEVAWFLTGLAYASTAMSQGRSSYERPAFEAYKLLLRNQGTRGAFGHLATRGSAAGQLRGRIGSFADQVYPIYALIQFATVSGVQTALAAATSCAENICRVQGPWGQWWWHYDASTGETFQQYPVFAVHQDGMAPMALLALGETAGLEFDEPVFKGLNWIGGVNELGYDMRDASCGVIWRSFEVRNKYKQAIKNGFRLLGANSNTEASYGVKVNFESRPYHLGWLLYAYAGRIIKPLYSADQEV
jgi:hypothetical protein